MLKIFLLIFTLIFLSGCMFGGTEWGTSSAPDMHITKLHVKAKTVDSSGISVKSVKWFYIPYSIEPDTLLNEGRYTKFTMSDSFASFELPSSAFSFRLYAVDTASPSAGMFISNQLYIHGGDTLINLDTALLKQPSSVSGRLTFSDSTTPIQAKIFLPGTLCAANTDSSGYFTIRNVPHGTFIINAKERNGSNRSITLNTTSITVSNRDSINIGTITGGF
ncbi:MAG: hypothetical protein JNL74_06210 [Fibrobacteres bacterium]|nr:hypothetical protein [Fibrobacterota bacterium]